MGNSERKKSLAIIGTVGVPSKYGGFETLAHHLVIQLRNIVNITVYNSTYHYTSKERVSSWKGASIIYIPLKPNGISSIFYDIVSMFHAMFYADTLLLLGVSGCIFLPILKLLSNRKVVVNVDGMEWKREKWGFLTKTFLNYSEKLAIRYADEVVCDNAVIHEYVKKAYQRNTSLIAYGADHANKQFISQKLIKEYPFLKEEYAFKVCRIEPENNIEMVLQAFSTLRSINLVIVGNWSHSSYGITLKSQFSCFENIKLLDPIYDLSILDALRGNCSFYIHGHSAGGTNPSLVEAMYLGLPVIAYEVGYNIATTQGQSLYFSSAESLAHKVISTNIFDLYNIGKTLRYIALKEYTWENIAAQYYKVAFGDTLDGSIEKRSKDDILTQHKGNLPVKRGLFQNGNAIGQELSYPAEKSTSATPLRIKSTVNE